MLLSTILFPMIAGTAVSALDMDRGRRRKLYAVVLALADLLGVLALVRGGPLHLLPLAGGLELYFALDRIGRWFLAIVLLVYTAACVYAFEYMNMEEREPWFFGFWFASFGAVMAACMAGNLVTLYLCFELATLSSMPMVLHEGTREAIAAALKYLFYSIGGALLGLFAVMVVCVYGGEAANAFAPGGFLDTAVLRERGALLEWAVFCGVVGFGAKSGMYPLHGWLPAAHPIAPAPASALLSGVIAKLGILAVIRLVYFSAGPAVLAGTTAQKVWIALALLTIFMGSMMAFREKVMKKRLAYSSISQISYIMLGLALLNEEGLTGGLLHFAAHAVSKGALFLCAGVFIYKLGKREAGELRGAGVRMPVTMWCFLIASLSLVGIPPLGGFVSKWHLALGALGSGLGVWGVLAPIVLLVSAFLTAGYLLPVAVDAFFPGRDFPEEERAEPSALMTVPLCVLCGAAACVGLFGAWLAGALDVPALF